MNSYRKTFFEAAKWLIIFLLIQFVVEIGGVVVYALVKDYSVRMVMDGSLNGDFADLLAITSVLSGLATVVLFVWRGWAVESRAYLRSRPWVVLLWIVVLTVGAVLPEQGLADLLGVKMDEQTERMFLGLMSSPWGYLAIGIMAPLAEEFVFRGAILRTLLKGMPGVTPWLSIAISAAVFACVHGNMAQGLGAFLMGLLLGWMYYRSKSLVPSIVMHWANNTLAYVMVVLAPQTADMTLLELFGGSHLRVAIAVGCSLLIAVPALLQVVVRLKPAEE